MQVALQLLQGISVLLLELKQLQLRVLTSEVNGTHQQQEDGSPSGKWFILYNGVHQGGDYGFT